MKYFDRINKRLVYIKLTADHVFWDNHWEALRSENIKNNPGLVKNKLIFRITKKYLRPGDGVILEGGCGRGDNVFTLVNSGYNCIGVDSAEKTIALTKENYSELDVRCADIRRLPFKDGFFSGYWSVGVIEHFFDGYDDIAREMLRVIKNGGYLFLLFPQISRLRRIKSLFGFYKLWNNNTARDNFYQFALNQKSVRKEYEALGFRLIRAFPVDGIKGLKDEVSLFRPVLKKIINYKGKNTLIKIIRKLIDILFSWLSAHCVIMVFKKEANFKENS